MQNNKLKVNLKQYRPLSRCGHFVSGDLESLVYASLRTANVSHRSSPLRDFSRGGIRSSSQNGPQQR